MKWRAIYTNLRVDVIVRLPHSRNGDSQGQKTFLAASTDKQTSNYDIECSNHHLSLAKRLSRSKMKWRAIYTNLHIYYLFYYHLQYLYIKFGYYVAALADSTSH